MLVQFSKYFSSILVLAVSVPAFAGTTCKYINEYQHDNNYGDERIQSYLNFYSKMGAGGATMIKIPGCIAKKTDEAIRQEQIGKEKSKDSKEGVATVATSKDLTHSTPNFSSSGTYEVTQFVLADKKAKEPTEQKVTYSKGTSTFCKAIVICENDDGNTYLDNVFCRGETTDKCPTATECLKDNTVAMNGNGLSIDKKNLTSSSSGLEGEQKPSTVQGR